MHGPAFLHVLRRLVAAALVLFSLGAHAVTWNAKTDMFYNATTGVFTPGPVGQGSGAVWSYGTKAPGSTGPVWTGPAKQLPFNPSPTANFRAAFSASAIARSLARPSFLIPIIAGSVLQELLNQACIRLAGGAPGPAPGGQWEQCNYSSTTIHWSKKAVNTYLTPQPYSDTISGACGGGNYTMTGAYSFACTSVRTNTGGYWVWACPAQNASGWVTMQNVTSGNETSGGTGVCGQSDPAPNGTYSPATDDQAQSLLEAKLTQWTQADFAYGYSASANNAGNVLDGIMSSGNSVEATLQAPTVTPQTITEEPVTVNVLDPVTNTTKTTTETTTNDYSCLVIQNGAAVQCSQTKTKTQATKTVDNSNPGNSTNTGTVTSVVKANPQGQDGVDQCAKYPDTVGCSKFGDPASADPLAKDTKQITITPTSFAGGSCPAPVNFTVFGHSYAFSYDTLCAKLALVKVLLLALAGLAAAWIFADGFRVS